MAVLVARTAWYGLLVPVPQQLLGNRTKWPYWSSHHRAATVIRYAERQPKSAIGWLRLKISLGIAGS